MIRIIIHRSLTTLRKLTPFICTLSMAINLVVRAKSWLFSFKTYTPATSPHLSNDPQRAKYDRCKIEGMAIPTFNFVNPIVPWAVVVATLKAERWEYTLVVLGHFFKRIPWSSSLWGGSWTHLCRNIWRLGKE